MLPYSSEQAALEDAVRLAQGMTRKCTLAKSGTGGAKAVIIGSPEQKSEQLLRAYAGFVERLNGAFLTGNDVNISFEDMQILAEETQYVLGATEALGPSAPVTAHGVYSGMRAAVERVYGQSDLEGLTVAIQGLGGVGLALAQAVSARGGALVIADINEELSARVARELGAQAVACDDIYDAQADIFAPCALGGVLNSHTIQRLRCTIVCGAANNQLAGKADGDELFQRGILYAPDYVVNAGGAIYVRIQRGDPDATRQDLMDGVECIYETTRSVLVASEKRGVAPSQVADQLADEMLQQAKSAQV